VDIRSGQDGSDSEIDDGWGGLSVVNEGHRESTIENETLLALMDGDENEIIDEESLPFMRYKPPPDEEELATIRTSTYVDVLKRVYEQLTCDFSVSLGSGCPGSPPHNHVIKV